MGMGKSASMLLLKGMGVPVLDTDVIAREIVKMGQPALGEIVATFGDEVLDEAGELNRGKLASIVFGKNEELRRLEAILHPKIRTIWQKQIEDWRAGNIAICAVVIPLLFETACTGSFDKIICVACSVKTQSIRLQERGWDVGQIRKRIEAQLPVEKKMELSNHVIWTEGSMETHRKQLEEIFRL